MQRVPALSKADWHSKFKAEVNFCCLCSTCDLLSFKVLPACAERKGLGDGRSSKDIPSALSPQCSEGRRPGGGGDPREVSGSGKPRRPGGGAGALEKEPPPGHCQQGEQTELLLYCWLHKVKDFTVFNHLPPLLRYSEGTGSVIQERGDREDVYTRAGEAPADDRVRSRKPPVVMLSHTTR